MALLCSGTFKGIPLKNIYVKITNLSLDSDEGYYQATFAAYLNEHDATNFVIETAIDFFTFVFPANKTYEDIYSEAYNILKNHNYILDRLKYDEFGNKRYENTQYFPQLTSMEDI